MKLLTEIYANDISKCLYFSSISLLQTKLQRITKIVTSERHNSSNYIFKCTLPRRRYPLYLHMLSWYDIYTIIQMITLCYLCCFTVNILVVFASEHIVSN